MRGRNNGNRRGPNPLTRSYESNGPDVKIRGSAQQIAEKYSALARDATSSGDRVMAENYLQHAEHYNRIIAAAQAQMPIQQVRDNRDDLDDDQDFERDDQPALSGQHHAAVDDGSGPQPFIEGTPAELAFRVEQQEMAAAGEAADAGPQHVNGNGARGAEGEEAAAPRRPRRPRRSAARGEEGQTASGGGRQKREAAGEEQPAGDAGEAAHDPVN